MGKKICVFLSAIFCIGIIGFSYAEDKPRNKFQRAVDDQHSNDVKKKEELVAKMKAILGTYNKRLRQSGIKDANLDVPIEINKVENITDNTEAHSKEADKPKVFAFANTDASLYASSDAGTVVGKVAFAEEVELLEKVTQEVMFKGKSGQWVAVRKTNKDEGWIHSSLIVKDRPTKREEVQNKDGELSFEIPTAGRETSPFGSRVDPVTKQRNAFHSGVDLAAPLGTPVVASADGTVRRAEFNKNGYGNLIVLEHAKDFTTYYGHLSKIHVTVGQNVKKGDNIGAVGSTGKSTGPHLHFEVRRGEKALDPDAYIR
ncbi:MAG TPA: peptidoglycan DD-metalloendopeptidase family protein [Spirochaetota bacterium]